MSTQVNNLVNMIDGYIDNGGHHLNVNVFDRQTLLEAQKNPNDKRFQQLTIRVSGLNKPASSL